MSKLDSLMDSAATPGVYQGVHQQSGDPEGCRLYYISCELNFFVVDPEGYEVQLLEMDRSELQVQYGHEPYILVESDEVLLLFDVFDAANYDRVRKWFMVLRADVCKHKWVKVRSIGERALLVHDRGGGVSLVADHHDGRGVIRNCIYFFQRGSEWAGSPGRWKVFDLESEELSDVENLTPPVAGECMFVLSLC